MEVVIAILAVVVVALLFKMHSMDKQNYQLNTMLNRERDAREKDKFTPVVLPYVVWKYVRVNQGCEVRIRGCSTGDEAVLLDGSSLYVRNLKTNFVTLYDVIGPGEDAMNPEVITMNEYYVPNKASKGYDKFGRKKKRR